MEREGKRPDYLNPVLLSEPFMFFPLLFLSSSSPVRRCLVDLLLLLSPPLVISQLIQPLDILQMAEEVATQSGR